MATAGILSRGNRRFQHVRLPHPHPHPPATVAGSPPGSRRPVCRFWLQGRCNRLPCPFLHSRDQPPPAPVHHAPTHQRRPGSLVWRNPNAAAPAPGTSPKPRDDGSKKRSFFSRDEDAPERLPPPTIRPRRDDDVVFDKRSTLITDIHGDASADPDCCLPLPTICPRRDDENDENKQATIITVDGTEEAPDPEGLPVPVARHPCDDGDEGIQSTGATVDGEDASVPECCLLPPIARPPRDDDHDLDKRSTAVDVQCPPPSKAPHREAENDEDGADCGPPGVGAGSFFCFVTSLGGHQQAVTGIALPSGASDKMFTGGADGTVRVWDCGSGQCLRVFEFGGPISCVMTDGHWVFAGGHGGVHGCNALTGDCLTLPGSTVGQVCSLDTSADMVFAGMTDGSILAWKATNDARDAGGLCFRPAAWLRGHTSAVVSLCVGSGCRRLYSGSTDRTIRGWDVETLQCVYTVFSAHEDAVTSLVCWSNVLMSCSLDGTIKAWAAVAKEDGGGLREVYTRDQGQGVVLLNGVYDGERRHVLMCALADNTVRLYDLPSFADRGSIACGGQVRAMHSGPQGFFFTGDATGEVGVWRWS